MQRAVNCTAACWQPQKKILAIGWDNGEIVVWNEAERELHEVPKLHNSGMACLAWSAKGSRLVSTDLVSKGTVINEIGSSKISLARELKESVSATVLRGRSLVIVKLHFQDLMAVHVYLSMRIVIKF